MTSKHISHGLEGKHRVAIVVPVYNVSKYLAECLDSALNQTYKEITIFAVNDGSTDDSGEILDEFAKKHSKLLVVHKSNGGVSSARNAGLDAIKNSENHFEFVYFLDSDDTIPNDFVQKLVDALEKENADVAICPVYEFDKQGGKVKSHPVEKPKYWIETSLLNATMVLMGGKALLLLIDFSLINFSGFLHLNSLVLMKHLRQRKTKNTLFRA